MHSARTAALLARESRLSILLTALRLLHSRAALARSREALQPGRPW